MNAVRAQVGLVSWTTPAGLRVAQALTPLANADVLALTLWGECRSETPDGQIAVAQVITNRIKDGRWGHDVRHVATWPHQFSCWWAPPGTEPNTEKLFALAAMVANRDATPMLREARWIAEGVLAGHPRDLVKDSTHYLTADLFRASPPHWAQAMTVRAHVGAHVFGVAA